MWAPPAAATSFFTDTVCTLPARRCHGHRTGARRRPVTGVELPAAARHRHPRGARGAAGGVAAVPRRRGRLDRPLHRRGTGSSGRRSGCGGGSGSSPAARSTCPTPATTSSTRSPGSRSSSSGSTTDDDQGLPQRLPAPRPPAEAVRRPLHRDPLPVPRLRVAHSTARSQDVPAQWDFPHVDAREVRAAGDQGRHVGRVRVHQPRPGRRAARGLPRRPGRRTSSAGTSATATSRPTWAR